jgi:hypothetical protein
VRIAQAVAPQCLALESNLLDSTSIRVAHLPNRQPLIIASCRLKSRVILTVFTNFVW